MTCHCLQWISFGDYTEMAQRVKAAGIKLIVQVQTTEEALQAAAVGADAIVAQVWVFPVLTAHTMPCCSENRQPSLDSRTKTEFGHS
jgi:hypothetical protein